MRKSVRFSKSERLLRSSLGVIGERTDQKALGFVLAFEFALCHGAGAGANRSALGTPPPERTSDRSGGGKLSWRKCVRHERLAAWL